MNDLKQTVIVLSAMKYAITNEKTKEIEVEGCSVRFIYADNLTPCISDDGKTAGHKPAKVTLPLNESENVKIAPALYEVTLGFSVDSQGKAAIKAKDFKFVSEVAVSKKGAKTGFGS